MQILIPIQGYSDFFPIDDFYFPKPLVEIAGMPMIELVVRHLKSQFINPKFIFVIDPEASRSFSLDRTLHLVAGPNSTIIEKPGPTSGALCSCLLSINALDPDEPLIIVNSDQIIEDNLAQAVDFFVLKRCTAGVVTFDSVHPRWSYVVNNADGYVVQIFEKKVASRKAIAGFYYYSQASIFLHAAKQVILNHSDIGGAYFISSSLNEVILKGGKVLEFPIDSHSYHSFYAPSKIAEFENSDYAVSLRAGLLHPPVVNVIIPAAGEGSRFKEVGWKKPKPFIDVDGQTMIEHVISNVTPTASTVTILLRQQHLDNHPAIHSNLTESGHRIIPVSELTEGTASTVLLASKHFNNDHPMLIANSDQLADFDVNHFIDDCFQRNLDGSIVVFRDPLLNPKWSFARVDKSGLVLEVAEKHPISDLATVGIYLFSKGKNFVESALAMIIANDRVNNEFYTCPVYNYMIRNGARIGVYEIPMKAMAGLGTPDDLTHFLKMRCAPPSTDSPSTY